jgi:calcium-dependent protein kinase
MYEEFEDARNVFLVMELCNGGELFDAIVASGSFTERIAANTFEQAAKAIKYLHS